MPTTTSMAPFVGMKTGGKASSIEEITTREDVELFVKNAQKRGLPYFVLGDGTNTLFRDGDYEVCVGLMRIKGMEQVEDGTSVTLTVGAGENWDEVVARSVKEGLQGIEALSGIPGTAGAGPIQNIGAYGNEIKEALESVETYDTKDNTWVQLKRDECKFAYRDSIFKQNPSRFIITNITLRLKKKSEDVPIPEYKDVKAYFRDKDISKPSLMDIRQAIIGIRAKKLPNPSVIPNCGSFFKNPVVPKTIADSLLQQFPQMPSYLAGMDTKLAAGWLVEQCGFKGKHFGHTAVFDNNALVITTETGATTTDVLNLADKISHQVFDKFGVTLEREPVLLP